VSPVRGSNWPNSPDPCAVYQIIPSVDGATSCGWDPDGTGNSSITNLLDSKESLKPVIFFPLSVNFPVITGIVV
jgi:hypothetical protein